MAAQRATWSVMDEIKRESSGVPRAQKGVLGNLAPPAGPLSIRECCQRIDVTEHRSRLPKRTDQILALGQIDPGLAPNGRVNLAQQAGGHVHVGVPR